MAWPGRDNQGSELTIIIVPEACFLSSLLLGRQRAKFRDNGDLSISTPDGPIWFSTTVCINIPWAWPSSLKVPMS